MYEVERKKSEAHAISKEQITDKLKSDFSDRFDQMIVSSDVERNDIMYFYYKAKYVNIKSKKIVFALTDDVRYAFDMSCSGGVSQHGEAAKLNNSLIDVIKGSDALIAEKNLTELTAQNNYTDTTDIQLLKKGYLDSKEAKASEENSGKAKEEESVFASISKILNEPILDNESEGFNFDDDYKDIFADVDWFGSSDGGSLESYENEYIKSNSLRNLTLEYVGDEPSKQQPLFFVPQLTKTDDCKVCRTAGEVECPTCKGQGKFKCMGYVGSRGNRGHGNWLYKCENGKANCEYCDGKERTDKCRCDRNGKIPCPKCSGQGELNCERKNGASYGIGKLANRISGKPFCDGKGKIPCKPCKASGYVGTLVYIKPKVEEIESEFFQYTNQKIEQIYKKPSLLFPYLNKNNVQLSTIYKDINNSITDNYDQISSNFTQQVTSNITFNKGNNYPRLLNESVYYDIIPLLTLEYNHILTATNHYVSAIPNQPKFDILFHSDPTAVQRFSLKNLIKSYLSKWPEAFMTKSYKYKRDKFNEIRLLIYIAKADGAIADEEKIVLANTITGLTEYTAKEKSQLFGLMSSKSLPKLVEDDFVFSSQERAQIAFQRLDEMAMEDSNLAKEEVILAREYKDRISNNIAKYKGKFKQFLVTWQVSLTVLMLILATAFGMFYIFYLKPRKDAQSLHLKNTQYENILNNFITWTSADTTKNLRFHDFLMDLSISQNENANFDESIRDLTPQQLLSKINHTSELKLENTQMSYKDFWKEHSMALNSRIDSLMPILERRISQQRSTTSTDQETTEKVVLDDIWYTVSDPDGFTNLRSEPNGSIIRQINEGEIFKIIASNGEYKKVQLKDGTEGYVHASRIVESDYTEGVEDAPDGDGYETEESDEGLEDY